MFYASRILPVCILMIVLMSSCKNIMIHKNLSRLRQTWNRDSLTNTTIYYQSGSFAETDRNFLRITIEQRRADILQIMGEKNYPARIDAFFFQEKHEMNEQLKTHGEGVAFAKDNVAAFTYSQGFEGYNRHELAHVISINLWGETSLWIEEGFATLTDEDRQTKDFHSQAAAILGTDKFIPIEKIFKGFRNYDGNWYRYVETASLLGFIREKYGIAALKQVWRNKRASFAEHAQKDLVAEWLAMLRNAHIK
ncbi:MAG: hypothetical protein ABI581_03135 [Sediminibacterium sp.]